MTPAASDLDRIQIASPCSVSWDSMKGDDQVRLCKQCQLNVYNLSTMTLDEISALLESKDGRACVRFYRRADGTVLTEDCSVGLRLVRRKLLRAAMAVASFVAFVTLGLVTFSFLTATQGRPSVDSMRKIRCTPPR